MLLASDVNRRTLRVHSFHSGLARWSLLRYTVPNRAPIDIYFFVNHCYRCVSLGCFGCLVLPVNAWFALRQPKLRSTFGQKLKLWLLPTPWNDLLFLVSSWHILHAGFRIGILRRTCRSLLVFGGLRSLVVLVVSGGYFRCLLEGRWTWRRLRVTL